MISSAEYIASAARLEQLPVTKRPHIAMVGRSNVGKSSMINHLTSRRNLARVSSKPGRTQTMNLYEIDKKFYLMDLPGYGYAKKSLSQREFFADMIYEYLKETPQLKLVLLIIDARIPLSELDASMLEWLKHEEIPFLVVLNKVDALKKTELTKLHETFEAQYPGVKSVDHSIDSPKHKQEILHIITQALK